MSGQLGNGARALFANAPVLPAAPTIPTVPPGSNLAAAMMAQHQPMNLQTPSTGIGGVPLASMMQALKGQPNPTPGHNTSALTQDANGNWVGTPGQAPPPQTLSWGNGGMPAQGPGPGMPGGGVPGMPSPGAPGMMSGMPAPGTPSAGAPGTPGMDQPGALGQTVDWLRSLYGGGQG